MFVGEFARSIDANGRVALPAAFRDQLDGECYLRLDPRGALAVTPASRYEQEAEALARRVDAGEADPEEFERLGATTTLVPVDKHGRVTLDVKALAHAGIRPGGDVMFVGAVYGFAVWRPSRYATVSAERAIAAPARVWDDEEDADDE